MIEKNGFDEMLDTFLSTGGTGMLIAKITGLVLLVVLAYRAFGLEYRYTIICPHCKGRADIKSRVCRQCGRDIYPTPRGGGA